MDRFISFDPEGGGRVHIPLQVVWAYYEACQLNRIGATTTVDRDGVIHCAPVKLKGFDEEPTPTA